MFLIRPTNFRSRINAVAATLFFVAAFALAGTALPQNAAEPGSTPFRLGEKLTYNVSFERFSNVAYGEIYVASRGRLADKDAIELHARFKTLDFVSSAFSWSTKTELLSRLPRPACR